MIPLTRSSSRRCRLLLCLCLFGTCLAIAREQDHVRVATWNWENFGSVERGYGTGQLGPRPDEALKELATFIKNDLRADLLALQEIAVTGLDGETPVCEPLAKVVAHLGPTWKYVIDPTAGQRLGAGQGENLQNAFLWDSSRVRLLKHFAMWQPRFWLGRSEMFERLPLVGYFEALRGDLGTNDFVLVNIHLASGQGNVENHLASIILIEENLYVQMLKHEIKESDRILLGDFNENPFLVPEGEMRFDLFHYLKAKDWRILLPRDAPATRMDSDLSSVIDHVIVNRSAARHLATDNAQVMPPRDLSEEGLSVWRYTFSDHFPVWFELDNESRDDDTDWKP